MTNKKETNHLLVATTYLFLQAIAVGFSSWSFKLFADKNKYTDKLSLKDKLINIVGEMAKGGIEISNNCNESLRAKTLIF